MDRVSRRSFAFLCLLSGTSAVQVAAQSPGAPAAQTPNLAGRMERPLRYRPEGTDFVIENGPESFNRPLYGGNTAFRVDAGDRPEFSLYLPGRGGNLRLGIRTQAGQKWLHDADRIQARYRPGSMVYEVRDRLLGTGSLQVDALALYSAEGLILRLGLRGADGPIDLLWAFGGVHGQRGRRDGDIGTENEPVSRWFQLRPEYCRDNAFTLDANGFAVRSRVATLVGVTSPGSRLALADARHWSSIQDLFASAGGQAQLQVVTGSTVLYPGRSVVLAIRRDPRPTDDRGELATYLEVQGRAQASGRSNTDGVAPPVEARDTDLSAVFDQAERSRRSLAEQIVVDTPDPFINAAAAALCVAADAVWDEPSGTVMHGAVAWRSKLLGWRGPYLNDALGRHDRARRHIHYWAGRQNTSPIPEKLPPADASANLSRSEAALHSNGDMSNSHYDMNLVYMDMVFRHLLWTGDLDLARDLWPVIERHLAWERRLFRRPYGSEGLPLYEGYACIWASDDVAYHGGGAACSTAYNYWHNRMAARIARLIGKDAAPYDREADLIRKAMQSSLWLNDRGWYAEFRDLLGLQLAHASPALWTFYHTVDSQAASPMEAWQMTRFVDTQIGRIPVRGPGLPAGDWFTLPTTNWMPYTWSTNNVVMSEVAHTALAYWQAGRAEEAWRLFKGAVLDSMYMGLCPGNAGMCTAYDVYRRETQRDFADSVGMAGRALVEGLFGVSPDALAGEIRVRPGFPKEWDHAGLRHTRLLYRFSRNGLTDLHLIEPNFARPQALCLQLAAQRDGITQVTVNGRPGPWHLVEEAVGQPLVEIRSAAAPRHEVSVTWQGRPLADIGSPASVAAGSELQDDFSPAQMTELVDPQGALSKVRRTDTGFTAAATGTAGHRTIFAGLRQGAMRWWQPVSFEILADRAKPVALPEEANWVTVDLSGIFNDRVTQIFRNEYLSPRSPYCSLALPKQGIGSWCRPTATAQIDDTGLREAAGRSGGRFVLPNGIAFATPGPGDSKNIVFTSQWDNYPHEVTIPLHGRARHAALLMAGSTDPMQSRFENGEVVVTYADGSTSRLALENPTTWWPIDEDYFVDDFQFRRPGPIPPRVDLKTGRVRTYTEAQFAGKGGKVPGGAATVLDLPLDPDKGLGSLTVRTLANEVVIGLMAVTLAR
ncbi:MAG: DUF4450 domain-containing protein [Phycisphaerae bacterium]|nr:DUF4450 domain-containing protein [Phycisphaerae bacterium]